MSRKKIFISYSREDREWLDKLRMHLKPLERWELINVWSDTRIGAGNAWEMEITKALNESKAAILLVSPAFLASDYIWEKEMPHIMAHQEQGMVVLPLIIKPCAWRLEKDLRKLQARPIDSLPLSTVSDPEIDLNLTEFVYELALLTAKVPSDIAAQELDLISTHRKVTDQNLLKSDRNTSKFSSPTENTVLNLLNTSWTGAYNDSLQITLSILKQNGTFFQGKMDYLNYKTTTNIQGKIIENDLEIIDNSSWSAIGVTELSSEKTALQFKEIDYEQKGAKSIDFNGEYIAVIKNEVMSGSWVSNGNSVGHFDLHRGLK